MSRSDVSKWCLEEMSRSDVRHGSQSDPGLSCVYDRHISHSNLGTIGDHTIRIVFWQITLSQNLQVTLIPFESLAQSSRLPVSNFGLCHYCVHIITPGLSSLRPSRPPHLGLPVTICVRLWVSTCLLHSDKSSMSAMVGIVQCVTGTITRSFLSQTELSLTIAII